MSKEWKKLKAWREANPEKYQAQRAAYAVKAAEARRVWRKANRGTERAALMERRHNDLAYRLTKRYRITIAEARYWVDRMPGGCEICGAEVDPLNFDHCHATGRPRGWLCSQCNWAIGHMADSPELLRAAAEYLEERGP